MHGVRVHQNVFLFLFVVDWMMSLLTIALVFLSLLLPTWSATSGSAKSRPEVISVRHGAVATDDRRCSRIGKDVLLEGGNAVDVSVAAALCLGVVSPASSGIGGGAFMLVRLASGEAHAFDMRETAPLLASEVRCAVHALPNSLP